MKRGNLVTIVLQGAYGKPRPALVVQSDLFATHPSVTILPVTSELRETPLFRVEIKPTAENGLNPSLTTLCHIAAFSGLRR
ncbi:MAG: type II toxin-antitoxin system PemK/MazF family toxin, partial [Candidatus Accumulibacter phosphatis]